MNTDAAIARRAFRQVWIGAIAWAVTFGATAASSALTYVSSFPTVAARQQVAATTGTDKGFAVLLGPVSAIGTVGGYTVYKGFAFLTSIGAIWAVLAATRLLRGEEDAGRWQLVLAGTTRASRATVATLLALGVAVGVIFAGTTLIVMGAARNPDLAFGAGETVLYGLSIAIAPAVFLGVGAVTSQLGRTRRVATGLGIGVFAVAFVLRMIADSGPGVTWLRWWTPFGWTELMRPLTRNDPWPLLPAAATVVVLWAAAATLASRRDAGSGVIASRDVARPRSFGLASPFGLAMRLELPALCVWSAGVAATGFAFGTIVKVATGKVPASLGDNLGKFGVHGSFVNQYVGVAFLLIASVVALIPAGQLGAASEEETSGRLTQVVAQPANRSALLGQRLGLAAAGIAAAGLLAGIGTWLGARFEGVDLGLGAMVRSGLNLVPTALVALGLGAVMLAFAPRAATRTVYGVVAGSLIVDILGSTVAGTRWLEHLSLFHYMALAPAQPLDPTTLIVTGLVAVVLCALATGIFARRDLQLR